MPRRRTVLAAAGCIALALAAAPAGAGDDAPPQGAVVFTNGETFAGVATQIGDIAAGVLLIDGVPAVLECLEMPEFRDRVHAVYARYAAGEDRYWIGIDEHVQGSTEATGGFARAPSTTGENCGAPGDIAPTPLTMVCSTHDLLRDIT